VHPDRLCIRCGQLILGCVQSYAIKFFLDPTAFQREAELYRNEDLKDLMPATEEMYDNRDKRFTACDGYAFPPFIVIARGMTLEHWLHDYDSKPTHLRRPHISDVFHVLKHVATRLVMMHSLGLVHRDLKPSNILSVPQRIQWTLIDFGFTARKGALERCSWCYSNVV
jgi:serine/threonine protein kinase